MVLDYFVVFLHTDYKNKNIKIIYTNTFLENYISDLFEKIQKCAMSHKDSAWRGASVQFRIMKGHLLRDYCVLL